VPGGLEAGQVGVHDVVLALALDKVHPGHALIAGEPPQRRAEPNPSVILPSGAVEAIGSPSC
jgi:hypothetical protein